MGFEQEYLNLLRDLVHSSHDTNKRIDRTGTGTYSFFGVQLTHYFRRDRFPLLTTKKMSLKPILAELLWFISGSTNIKPLNDQGVHIWDAWADEFGELGPIYGKQWRAWTHVLSRHSEAEFDQIDQLANVINNIRTDPFSRRHVVSAWNVGDLPDMRLQPCHTMFQFYVSSDGQRLSCLVNMRSCDVFLGLPFNMASYAMLVMMVAQCCNLTPYMLTMQLGDAHLYVNHLEQARIQLARGMFMPPVIAINREPKEIDDFKFEHFELNFYTSHDAIPAPIAV